MNLQSMMLIEASKENVLYNFNHEMTWKEKLHINMAWSTGC